MTVSERVKFTTVPSAPVQDVFAVTINWPFVVRVVVESVIRVPF